MKREKSLLKGCQKRILQIKSPKSELFEEAYFIIRPEKTASSEDDMVKEAERLLKASTVPKKKRAISLGWDDILIFLAGVFLSFVIFGIAALFL